MIKLLSDKFLYSYRINMVRISFNSFNSLIIFAKIEFLQNISKNRFRMNRRNNGFYCKFGSNLISVNYI